MRIAAFALPLALVAVPAAAESGVPHAPIDARNAARALSNPAVQDGIAQIVARLADAVMETRIGPVAALDPDADLPSDATLGDLAARGNPAYRRDMMDSTRGAVAASGHALGAAAAMSDELQRTADRLARVLRDTPVPR